MSMQSLYNVRITAGTDILNKTNDVCKYIILNRHTYLDTDIQQQFYKVRNYATSGISTLFSHIIDTESTHFFAPIDTSRSTDNIPDLLANPLITLDSLQFKDPKLLSSYPEFNKKVIINLNHLIRKKINQPDQIEISDINELYKLFVRGLLVMSYNDSDGWLTPQMTKYIMQTYSISIANLISQKFYIFYPELTMIVCILSLYMAQMLSHKGESLSHPTLMMLCTYLGDRNSIKRMLDELEEDTRELLTPTKVVELIVKHGPDRLKSFTPGIFYSFSKTLGQDAITTMVSFEYPPYWVYQLILCLSGNKLGLLHQLKNNKLIDPGKEFIKNLVSSPKLIESIKR